MTSSKPSSARAARLPAATRLALGATLAFAATLAAAQSIPAPAYRAGDTWVYQEIDNYNRLQRDTITRSVSAAGPESTIMTSNRTGTVVDTARIAGGTLRSGSLNDRARGVLSPGLDLRPFPLAPGRRWSQTIDRADPQWNESRRVRVSGRVGDWETVRVPAGEFKAIRITRDLALGDWDPFRNETLRRETEWYVPELKMPVKVEVFEEYRPGRYAVVGALEPGDRFTWQLERFDAGR